MDPFKQKLNAAEIVFALFFILLIVVLAISLPKQYSWIATGLGGGFGMLVAQGYRNKQEQEKHPTIEDIQRKYPSRKSKQQLEEERKERHDAYDRDFADRKRKAKEVTQSSTPRKNADSAKYKKLLAMLGGDRATADRLISTYGIDKATSDLERDRRI